MGSMRRQSPPWSELLGLDPLSELNFNLAPGYLHLNKKEPVTRRPAQTQSVCRNVPSGLGEPLVDLVLGTVSLMRLL